jgi:hypothetical protein
MIYFVSSYVFGIVLVISSVGWWIYSSSTKHVLEIVVRDVPSVLNLTSDDAYIRPLYRAVPGKDKFHTDYYFAFVRSAPFSRGDVIWFKYWISDGMNGGVGDPQVKTMELTYHGEATQLYEIEYDATDKPPKLVRR